LFSKASGYESIQQLFTSFQHSRRYFLQCDESLIEKIPLAKERYVASIFTSMILNNEGVREWRVKAYKRG